MKRFPLVSLLAAALLLMTASCGHVDLTPESDPNRIVTGTVNVRMDLLPPPDSEVSIRLVEPSDLTAAPAVASPGLVIGERGTRSRPEVVVAEQVIRAPAAMPVPFRLEFRADDTALRRGLNIEARISWGGKIRFRTVDAQVVTLATVAQPQTVWVEPVR